MAEAMAFQFLELFPECAAWDVVILDQEKKKLDGGRGMSTQKLRSKLPYWSDGRRCAQALEFHWRKNDLRLKDRINRIL